MDDAPARTGLRAWGRAHPGLVTGLRWALSLGVLGLTLAWLDLGQVIGPLRRADPLWALAALACSVPMMLAMAWRWSFTATSMGIELPLRVAWREYYVSVLLNSVLPGGIAGDVVRVARQAEGPERGLGLVARSVVVERAVGQLLLWSTLLFGAAWWGLDGTFVAVLVALGGVGLGVGLLFALGRHPRVAERALGRMLARFGGELRAALWGPKAIAVQLLTSAGSLLALIATYFCCAAAIGSSMTIPQALLVVPWILAATTVPLTVGGWGVRELSAMALFELAFIAPAEGAASSVLFGAVSLVAALPGLIPLIRRRSAPS